MCGVLPYGVVEIKAFSSTEVLDPFRVGVASGDQSCVVFAFYYKYSPVGDHEKVDFGCFPARCGDVEVAEDGCPFFDKGGEYAPYFPFSFGTFFYLFFFTFFSLPGFFSAAFYFCNPPFEAEEKEQD